jgi:hypothetical protein
MGAGYDLIFFADSDNTIILEQLKNKVTDLLITGATVNFEIFSDDPPTASISGPTAFTEDTVVNGKYIGDISDTVFSTPGATGTVVIDATDTAGSNALRTWILTYIVQRGRSRV